MRQMHLCTHSILFSQSIEGVFRKRSLKGGPSRAQWEDVTGSTPLTFVNDCVSFTTTVSARFWLMDCRNISDATKMATELYKEVIHVPFIARFVVFAKKIEPFEARLRVFCMTDDREDKTLEKHELYTEVAKSRDVEVLEGKPQYIEMAGNLVPVTKSGDQLQLQFKAFRENRLPFTVRVKDQHADIVGRTLFMKEPKVAKGEPPQQPICILNIVLPEAVIPDSTTAFSERVSSAYRTSMFSLSKHQNDHYIGDIRIVDLSNLLGKDWIQLAPEIGITTDEIDEIINQNTDSIARQAQSMIRLYKDKPNYDIQALETALKNIGRDDIMKKCKSGRLSHSREFDEADLMKNSESVEELVRRESKRIQQINEREEVKYSAEEKEVEESESDEESAKRTVAERREKIVKRLSVERSIPASTQKKEITREITEIKRKSLIEDKKAHHESEILMQLPADNVIIKTTTVPEQVIKMKMGKMDSTEVSKSEFDKELTHKLKTSGRSSEEEELPSPDKVDKIVQDISTAETTAKKDTATSSRVGFITRQEARDMTEDFLEFEKRNQLPSETTATVHEKFSEEFKEKTSPVATIAQETIKEVEQVISEVTETASKKVENIISSFESGKQEIKEKSSEITTDTTKVSETIKQLQETKVTAAEEISKTVEIESTKIEEKIADFEAKKVRYDFHGGEPKTQIPKLVKRPSEEPLKPTAAPRAAAETEFEKPVEAKVEKQVSKIPVKTGEGAKIAEVDARKLTQDFLQAEQKTQLPAQVAVEPKAAPAASKIPKVEPRKSIDKEAKIFDDIVISTATIMTSGMASEQPKPQPEVAAKAETVNEKLTDLIDTFHKIEEKIIKTDKPAEVADKIEGLAGKKEEPLVTAQQDMPDLAKKEDKVAEKVAGVIETFHKIEEHIVLDTLQKTNDFLSNEQQSQLPSLRSAPESLIESSQTSTASEPESVISVKAAPPASKIPVVELRKTLVEETVKPVEVASSQQQKPAPLNERQLTADFLKMEQQTQPQPLPQSQPQSQDQSPKIIADTTILPEVMQTKLAAQEPTVIAEIKTTTDKEPKTTVVEPESNIVAGDGIESAAPIGEVSPFAARKLTADFLANEQQAQQPSITKVMSEYDSDTFDKRATAPLSDILKEDGLSAPLSIEPRKSLTDAEFCKYVGETITKKMSEGLIEMPDELKQIASDIPHSQTPPPTPSDAKTEKQNEQSDLGDLEHDYLADTVTTLHTTTESTFERVAAISTVEHFSVHNVKTETFTSTDETDKLLHRMAAPPTIQKPYSQDTTSFTEMSASSPTPKTTTTTTTTTTLTTQIERTKVDLTAKPIDHPKKQTELDDGQRDAGDREYLEQIMGCGDVRRKILRLESYGSTESLESNATQQSAPPKYIGDKVTVVKDVVQSIENKISGTEVEAIPFPVHKRATDQEHKEPNISEVEKQILTAADLALDKLIKCEPPTEVVKRSPVEAMERGAIGMAQIEEEVCEKICEKRKAFVVAEDLNETQKTLDEQVVDINRQVEQVPGSILPKDLVSKETILETLPKVKEVVQDIERRYTSTSLDVTPFSPRKRETVDRKADLSTIEQQILSETDLVLENLTAIRTPEQKIVSPVLHMDKTSPSVENLEVVCEKICSKRKVSDMAKEFHREPDSEHILQSNDIKLITAKFLLDERTKHNLAENIKQAPESDNILSKQCDKQEFPIELNKYNNEVVFPKLAQTVERLHSISKSDIKDTKEFINVATEYERKLSTLILDESRPKPQTDKQFLDKFPTHEKDDIQLKAAVHTAQTQKTIDFKPTFPSDTPNIKAQESESDEEIDHDAKVHKIKLLSNIEKSMQQSIYVSDNKVLESTEINKSENGKFPTNLIAYEDKLTSELLSKSKTKVQKTDQSTSEIKPDKKQKNIDDRPKSPIDVSKQTSKQNYAEEKMLSSTTPLVPLSMTT
ncbi:ankyrin-2-like, partial [Drosophila navojoa]|uniref:ankyrin-2-like n=1 Tax=Drosophila navojoa TaxID=7232 RepID=UPI0011BF575F